MSDEVVFKPQAERTQVPYRGPTDSRKFNDFVDFQIDDMTDASDAINQIYNGQRTFKKITQRELEAIKERLAELERDRLDRNIKDAMAGSQILWSTDFRNLTNMTLTDFAQSRRCRVEPSFGQVTVPINAIVNRFHVVNPTTQTMMVADNIDATVTGVTEDGGTVTTGTPRNAFNGNNNSFWVREVSYPLSSDVDHVTVQLDVDVPARFDTNANLVYLRPFPLGTVDIDSILVSTTDADPSVSLTGFPTGGVQSAGALRYIFDPRAITKLRITMTQRNWIEQDDRKVFLYGLQELGVCLTEWDKTDETNFLSNNGFVYRVDSPGGYDFNDLTGFWCDPDYSIPATDTGIYFKIYRDEDLTHEVWDSFSDPALDAVSVDLSAHNVNSVYIVGVLKYMTTSSVTPVLTNMALRYTTQ